MWEAGLAMLARGGLTEKGALEGRSKGRVGMSLVAIKKRTQAQHKCPQVRTCCLRNHNESSVVEQRQLA